MKKILIADDDEAICDSLSLLLEESGYIVQSITDMNKIKAIYNDLPDLILLDIWMSGYDGRDICRDLKSNKKTNQIPIIMISASKELVETVRDAGADDFIPKPFDINFLCKKINSYI